MRAEILLTSLRYSVADKGNEIRKPKTVNSQDWQRIANPALL